MSTHTKTLTIKLFSARGLISPHTVSPVPASSFDQTSDQQELLPNQKERHDTLLALTAPQKTMFLRNLVKGHGAA